MVDDGKQNRERPNEAYKKQIIDYAGYANYVKMKDVVLEDHFLVGSWWLEKNDKTVMIDI